MMKQKLALALGTMFLLATVVLPGLTFAQPTTLQEGEIILSGQRDIFYEGYGPTSSLTPVNFVDPSDGGTLASSSSNQTAIASYAQPGTAWPNSAFIGVIDLSALEAGFNLQVSTTDSLCTDYPTCPGSTIDISTGGLKLGTSSYAVSTLTLKDASDVEYAMTRPAGTDLQNIWYHVFTGTDWTLGDVTAILNLADAADLTDTATYTYPIHASSTQDIVSRELGGVKNGIYGTLIGYALDVPGGTPAGTYTGTITYTLNEVSE